MGFTIKEKAFLLHYFRKRVKQDSEDWPYFVPPYTEEFQARCPNLMVKKKSGQSLVHILEIVQNVQQIVKEHPSTSIRRLRQQVKLCYGTYQKIFKKDINLFPFACCKK
jgi:hypothetical protein